MDNELAGRARRGDLDAFEELFRRHQKRVYSIALQMLNNEAEAADATQEAFVRVYQSLARLKSDAAFVTWLKTTAINVCRDIIRRRKRLQFSSLDEPIEAEDGSSMRSEVADPSAGPAKELDRKQTRELVQRAIGSLSPDYREVVTLFYVDGADVAEIATVLGRPIGTVKSQLSRARSELKRKLQWYVED